MISAIEYATALGLPPGQLPRRHPAQGRARRSRRARTFVENLQHAAPEFAKAGIRLVIEAINTRDIPGFFLNRSAQAIEIMDEVGSDNLSLQYDFYHMQIMEGDLVPTFRRLKDRIGHVQIADNPGRNEPGTGEINYPFIFAALDEAGYDGFVGCEYKPKGDDLGGPGLVRALSPRRLTRTNQGRIVMKVGFIGLGIMGKPMAVNLGKGGHELFLHTRSGVPQDLLDAGGTRLRLAPRRSRRQADVIITMVPDTPRRRGGAVRRGRRRRGPVARARPWST